MMRLKKDRIFWIEILLVVAFGIFMCMMNYRSMIHFHNIMMVDSILFTSLILSGILLSIAISMFVGTEYSDGTIRNKIVIGDKRAHIYFANFFTCSCIAIFIYMTGILVISVIGIPMFGMIQMKASSFLILFLDGFLLSIAYASIYNLIGLLSSNKAYTVAISILIGFALLFLASWMLQAMGQPKMIDQAQIIDGKTVIETIKNPHYITGIKRTIYQILIDFNPGGQSMQIASLEMPHPYRMGIYSMIIIIVSNLAGMFCFAKKDIK